MIRFPGVVSLLSLGALLLAGDVAQSANAMKDSLYGDPAHPNLSGMWNPEFAYFGPPLDAAQAATAPRSIPQRPTPPQLTPPYAAAYAAFRKKVDAGEPAADSVTLCLAFGLIRFGTMPVEIIQTPGQITMNLGVLHDIRRIYLDGVGHTVGGDPSFNGDSVGHWDGDTLVVETNNVRPGTFDRDGIPYSEQLTTVERFRRVSATRLEVETFLNDPKAFLKPYTMHRAYVAMPPGSRFEEYICENNRDLDSGGK